MLISRLPPPAMALYLDDGSAAQDSHVTPELARDAFKRDGIIQQVEQPWRQQGSRPMGAQGLVQLLLCTLGLGLQHASSDECACLAVVRRCCCGLFFSFEGRKVVGGGGSRH